MSDQQLVEAEQLLRELETVEAQLGRVQEGLRQSHRLATLGTLSAIVAHEFNNILTPVISYCQLALANCDDADADLPLMRKALQRSLAGAEKAAHISSSMLGFAREADDDQPVAVISGVVDEVFTCLARDPSKDGIQLRLDVPAELRVAMSPVALQQVLLNLVLNARAALRQSRGTLAITARPTDEQRVLITVADTGPGIPADLLPRIFEPFVTRPITAAKSTKASPAAEKRERKGTGLGLAVCRDLVRQAGGKIEVESHVGKGTTFRIELPAAGD
jgi:signal transduction histidine kinase